MHGGKDCSEIGPATETGQCHDEPCPGKKAHCVLSLELCLEYKRKSDSFFLFLQNIYIIITTYK